MMMFAAMLKDAWRQTLDQWIQWVLYIAIVLVLIGVAVVPIDSLSGFLNNHAASPGVVSTPDENKQILWTAFKYIVASGLAGWVGLILALIMTAAQVPSMLRPGGVDLITSYPHPRWTLLLARYLGGIVFIAWYATLLIVGMYGVVGLRGGGWEPPFLLAIPATVGAFAVLYAISTLLGVLFRNPIMSILGTLAIWLLMFLLRTGMAFCFTNALQNYAVSEPKIYEFAKINAEANLQISTGDAPAPADAKPGAAPASSAESTTPATSATPAAPAAAADPGTGNPKPAHRAPAIRPREDLLAAARGWETAGSVFYTLATPFPNMDLFGLIYRQISSSDEMNAKEDQQAKDMEAAIAKYKAAADTSDESKQIVGKLEEISGRMRPTYLRDGIITVLFTVVVLMLAMWRFSTLDF